VRGYIQYICGYCA